MDRPLGSTHPRCPDLVYPVNYGYIEGIIAGDGAEQDIYLLGVNESVEEYSGIVYAVNQISEKDSKAQTLKDLKAQKGK